MDETMLVNPSFEQPQRLVEPVPILPARPAKHLSFSMIGAEDNFEALYQREYIAMVRLAFALVGQRQIAEEIVQEAFLEAHRCWDRLCTYDRPGAWIRRVVLQGCRRRRRRLSKDIVLLNRLNAQRPPRFTSNQEPLDAELMKAIRSLPKRQAQVVALVAIDDCTFAEAANILGCSEETARTHMRRARVRLKAALNLASSETSDV
jgi:RNA polymerase sigma-70 factor, ECF subfamily